MPDLVVIVPSRGRPEAAQELADNFAESCTADTSLVFAIDYDDPRLPGYRGVVQVARGRVGEVTFDSRNMVDALNRAAAAVLSPDAVEPPFAVGFLGDDHRPRTKGWDKLYLEALRELGTGMVYGDDLLQRQNLPTQIAMTSDIVRALGWMAPPDLVHLGVDNWWLELGRAAGCIRYLPDVVIEHMHPVAGKADWDDGHRRVNHPAMYQRDLATLARLRALELPGAVAKVKALRGER